MPICLIAEVPVFFEFFLRSLFSQTPSGHGRSLSCSAGGFLTNISFRLSLFN